MSSTPHPDPRSGIAKQTADPWQLDQSRRVETAQDNNERL